MTNPILLTPKKEFIISLLREAGHFTFDQDSFSFERIGEGRGFVSLIYKVELGNRSFVVKITNAKVNTTGEVQDDDLLVNIHDREIAFYKWITAYLTEPDADLTDAKKIPKFYGGRPCDGQEGCLILEDLSGRMTKDVDYIEGYSIHVVKSIIEQIVGYQSAYLSCPEKFVGPDITVVHNAHTVMSIKCVNDYAAKASWVTEEIKSYLLAWSQKDALVELQEGLDGETDISPTVAHRDLCPNNMLFEKTDAHPEGDLMAIIDFQCIRVGSPLLDVASAIAVCLKAADRRENTKKLIKFYVDEMKKISGRFTKKFDITKEMALRLFNHRLRYAALQLVVMSVYNPTVDLPKDGEEEGILSKRLRELIHDILPL